MLDKKAFCVLRVHSVLSEQELTTDDDELFSCTHSITEELSAQLNLTSEYLQWSIFLYYCNQQGYQ